MPVITLDIAPLSEDKKAKLVKELTMTAAKYIELPEETFTDAIEIRSPHLLPIHLPT